MDVLAKASGIIRQYGSVYLRAGDLSTALEYYQTFMLKRYSLLCSELKFCAKAKLKTGVPTSQIVITNQITHVTLIVLTLMIFKQTRGDSETASLISNTEKQETRTKPEADPEATRNGPIAKIVADGVQFLYSGKEAVGNEDQAVENGDESTTGNSTIKLDKTNHHSDVDDEESEVEGSAIDEEYKGIVLDGSEAAKHSLEELEQISGEGSHSDVESSHDHS
uniref:Uncharacterized protein n=1 Tax=Vitis vinifera TaxID=29760 RepID=A5C7I4_VITVI|nr:hypothetical protein VITISV_043083 [Vitis vinifera]